MVEEGDKLHTINFCRSCCSLRQGERKEPIVNGREWRHTVANKRSRDKLATSFGAHASTRSWRFTKNLLQDSVVAMSLNKEWPE